MPTCQNPLDLLSAPLCICRQPGAVVYLSSQPYRSRHRRGRVLIEPTLQITTLASSSTYRSHSALINTSFRARLVILSTHLSVSPSRERSAPSSVALVVCRLTLCTRTTLCLLSLLHHRRRWVSLTYHGTARLRRPSSLLLVVLRRWSVCCNESVGAV
jgi:hypothetical protein